MMDRPDIYTPYQPRAGSVPAGVCDYFRRQPDEALSPKDISIKWDIPHASVHTCLKPCVSAGLLVRDGLSSEYRAGPMLASSPEPSPAAAGAPKRPRRPPMELSVPAQTTMVIEADVPMPPPRASTRSMVLKQWEQVFLDLQQGERVRFPRGMAHRLAEVARRQGKAAGRTYALRHISDDESAIWRTK
jgi:hypothetical protein